MTPEARLQSECFKWFRLAYPQYKKLFFAIPNGGTRNKIEARNLKLQGVVAGVSDTFLAIPRNGKHGLFIEFKYGKNDVTYDQEYFLKEVDDQGYETSVVWSFDEFMNLIEKYLSYGTQNQNNG
jgi:hypothetical protein